MKKASSFCGYSDSSRGIRSFRGEFRFFRDSGAGVAPEHFPALFQGGHPQRHGDGSADSAGGEASDGRQRRSPGQLLRPFWI